MIAKAELHVHLEGSITPSMVSALAAKHRIDVPAALFNAKGEFHFDNFAEFLCAYDLASSVIKTADDYEAVTYDYLTRVAEQNTVYVELTASPDHALMNGLPYADCLAGIEKGIKRAEIDHGIVARILIVFVRHLGVDAAHTTLNHVLKCPSPYVVGVNLAGDEVNFAPNLFADVFAIAHSNGLSCTAHAGEVMGPTSVWEAINSLPLTRVGHGVRAIEDQDLIRVLRDNEITLEVCPGSNIALGVYGDFSQHPLRELVNAGLKTTLNSDDPPFFKTDIANEYEIAKTHFGFSDAELLQFTKNSINASFLQPNEKRQLLILIYGLTRIASVNF